MSGLIVSKGSRETPFHWAMGLVDVASATLLASGVAMGLYHRARTDEGQYLECCLLDAGLSLQTNMGVFTDGYSFPHRLAAHERATCRAYRTRQDWLFVQCDSQAQWESLCRVLERKDLLLDPRFDTPERRERYSQFLELLLEETFLGDTAEEWAARLDEAGITAGVIGDPEKWFTDEYLLTKGIMVEHVHPKLGLIRHVGPPFFCSLTPGVAQRPCPLVGENNEEILGLKT